MQLSGKYDDDDITGEVATHRNRFKIFCQQVEKIRRQQIKSEHVDYNKKKKDKNNGDERPSTD